MGMSKHIDAIDEQPRKSIVDSYLAEAEFSDDMTEPTEPYK